MTGTRHEEYVAFHEGLPFSISKIVRTPATLSHEHNWHENIEFHLLSDGNATEILDGKNYEVSTHDIVAIDSNIMHYTNSSEKFVYYCLIVNSAFLKQMNIDYEKLHFCPAFRDEKTEKLFEELFSLFVSDASEYRIAKLNAALLHLIIDLIERHTLPVQTTRNTKSNAFETIKSAITFIRNRYAEKLTLDEIAQAVYVDKFYLSREFRKITGKTVVNYINDYRCKNAARLISEGLRASEAALMCGFENMSYFTKTFYKHMGLRPSEYKRSHNQAQ